MFIWSALRHGKRFRVSQSERLVPKHGARLKKTEDPPTFLQGSKDCQESFCDVAVRDNGMGFAKDQARAVFEPFRRFVGETEVEESGIGMAAARQFVNAPGGKGAGATSRLTLPLAR